MDSLISRQAAIDALDTGLWGVEWDKALATAMLKDLPSAQPDFDEWCTDCKKYDQKKHCCPRFNRVIRNALKDAQPEPKWIPVTERLPEESGSYLVTVEGSQNGEVFERAVDYADFMFCGGYIDNFDTVNDWIEYGEWHVTAWMPLPEPYRPEGGATDV